MTATGADGDAEVAACVAFARALRVAGVPSGPDQVATLVAAIAHLDVTDIDDLYWAGRTCLVRSPEQLDRYDAVFAAWPAAVPHVDAPAPPGRTATPAADGVDADDDDVRRVPGEGTGAAASEHELLAAGAPTGEALSRLLERRIAEGLRAGLPERRTLRSRRARRGREPDVRRAVRGAVRAYGEVRVEWRRRVVRTRGLVVLIDVSGSMADSADASLRFAYAAVRGVERVSVWTLGTRLTPLTGALRAPSYARALARVGDRVADREGGTRLGPLLAEHLADPRRAEAARGAVVLVLSDGLERGDPAVLGHAVARLSRLAHRLVWVTPLAADPAYRPLTAGVRALLPHVDAFVPGHDLPSLRAVVDGLEGLDRRPRRRAAAVTAAAGAAPAQAPSRAPRSAATAAGSTGPKTSREPVTPPP